MFDALQNRPLLQCCMYVMGILCVVLSVLALYLVIRRKGFTVEAVIDYPLIFIIFISGILAILSCITEEQGFIWPYIALTVPHLTR